MKKSHKDKIWSLGLITIVAGMGGYLVAYVQFAVDSDSASGNFVDHQYHHSEKRGASADLENKRTRADGISVGYPSPKETLDNAIELKEEGTFDDLQNPNVSATQANIDELQQMLTKGDLKGASLAKQALLNLAKKDPQALDELLSNLTVNRENESLSDGLIQVLGQVKDPAVESFAYDLVNVGERQDKITGLRLLGDLKIPNEQTLDVAHLSMQQNREDPELLLHSMHALPKMTISSEKNEQILATLDSLSKHENEAVRSESLFKISQQAKKPEQLEPLFEALDSSHVDDKISAIMAIEQSNIVSEPMREILFEKMLDPAERPEVRAMAANSLNRFSLTESELSQIQQYRQEQRWNAAN